MAAIAVAESNPDGGIVFFPPGRFDINDATVDDTTEIIKITKSNIILKGSGSGAGGTELYQKIVQIIRIKPQKVGFALI